MSAAAAAVAATPHASVPSKDVLQGGSAPMCLNGTTANDIATTSATAAAADACQGKKKTIYLIRHAESEENRRLASFKNVLWSGFRWTIPTKKDLFSSLELMNVTAQVDSAVSDQGREQIQDMAEQLQTANFVKECNIQLIVHSPLERAKQTAQGLNLLNSSTTTVNKRVEELDLCTEKTPTEWITTTSFLQRIASFESWLAQQPEENIVVVGHSQFFKTMLRQSYKFENCDVWKLSFDHLHQEQLQQKQQQQQLQSQDTSILQTNSSTENNHLDCSTSAASCTSTTTATTNTLPPQWSDLKLLYRVRSKQQSSPPPVETVKESSPSNEQEASLS